MQYNAFKARSLLFWVARQIGATSIPPIWPVIYLADRRHLSEQGHWMLHDSYVALREGPIPLRTYAELYLQAGSQCCARHLRPDHWLLRSAREVELAVTFGQCELHCLQWAVRQAQVAGHEGLKRLVQGQAWERAGPDGWLDPLEVAREGDADAATLDFILRWREPPVAECECACGVWGLA
jgi:hypothetical protein